MGILSKISGMVVEGNSSVFSSLSEGTVTAMVWAYFIILLVFVIACYIYTSLAFRAISRKGKYAKGNWLAWIPCANMAIFARISKMKLWPFWFLIPIPLTIIGFLINPILGIVFLIIAIFLLLAFAVFSYIWQWKAFEILGYPGWWVLLSLIPYAGGILMLVFLGIVAWSKKKYL